MRHSTCIGIALYAIATTAPLAAQSSPSTKPAPTTAPTTASLDSLITQSMEEAGVMGFSAAVIVDQRVVWMKGYGFTDWQRTRPFTPNTTAKVASVAKPFVGVSMMRAVKEGKLSLDADINQYLPFRVVNPHRPDVPITLRHLATHTSGITDRQEIYRATYTYDGDAKEPLLRFLTAYFTPGGKYYARENFLEAKPGELREYSNIGAALVGLIVERTYGQPLNVYTRQHIFTPLKMTHTGWFLREVDRANHSTPFISQSGATVPIPIYGGTTYPDGGLRVGHGGNDPGVEVEMLSDVAGNVGVIYISNTSLSGTDRRATGAIFDALWKYGTHLRATGSAGSR